MEALQNIVLDIWNLLGEMSPYLLLGFFLAGVMHEFVPGRLYSNYLGGNNLRSVVYAALFGVPLPLCSCGVIPTAMGLRREGASAGATTSFLIATPQTGVDSIAATYALMGPAFAVIRPIVAFVTAIFGGVLVNKTASPPAPPRRGRGVITDSQPNPSAEQSTPLPLRGGAGGEAGGAFGALFRALRFAFVEMVEDIGKWLMVGLLVAGFITAAVPDSWFAVFRDNSLLSILLVLCISVPMYVCATGSIPIAVALMIKGLTPGAALVLLMAGPACNTASVLVVRKVMGNRTLAFYLAAIVSGAVLFGLGIDTFLPREWFTDHLHVAAHCCHGKSLGWFNYLCTLFLLGSLVHAFWPFGHRCHCHEGACECGTQEKQAVPVAVFKIDGMNCNHCAATVERAIASVEGVSSVSVSLDEKLARVEGSASAEAIRKAVESVGFSIL